MKYIELTQNKKAMVDDADYEWLNSFKWYFHPHRQTGYAEHTMKVDGKKTNVKMHHMIIGKPPKGFVTDHQDNNGVNNQRHNLRFCTDAENKRNRGKTRKNSSGIKGVYWQKQISRWYSRIMVDNEDIYLGTFDTPEQASEAYNKAALKYHGKYARLNP